MAVSPRQIGFASVADRTIQACLKQLFDFCEALRTAVNGIAVDVPVAFTPALAFGGASVGITYSFQIGKARQVGKIVHWQLRITLTSKGVSVGGATITGLPPSDVNGNTSVILGGQLNFVNPPVGAQSSGTTVTPLKIAGAGFAGMADTDFNNNSEIVLAGTYFTA